MKAESVPLKGAADPPMPVAGENRNEALVSWELMKFGRVASPIGVGGAVLKTTSLVGSVNSTGLTAIRPAKPVICLPPEVISPVNGAVASVNSGSCGLPLVSEVMVAVADSASTVVARPPLRTCSSDPDGLENCKPVEPSAAVSRAATAAAPPTKLTPTTLSFGSAVSEFGSGSAAGSSTRTTVILCWTLDASV